MKYWKSQTLSHEKLLQFLFHYYYYQSFSQGHSKYKYLNVWVFKKNEDKDLEAICFHSAQGCKLNMTRPPFAPLTDLDKCLTESRITLLTKIVMPWPWPLLCAYSPHLSCNSLLLEWTVRSCATGGKFLCTLLACIHLSHKHRGFLWLDFKNSSGSMDLLELVRSEVKYRAFHSLGDIFVEPE